MQNIIDFFQDHLLETATALGLIEVFLFIKWRRSIFPIRLTWREKPINISSLVSAISEKAASDFLSDTSITLISQAILKINFRKDGGWHSGQCFIYARNGDTAYIGLPKHCDNPEDNLIVLIDHTGKSYKHKWIRIRYMNDHDAAMMPIPNDLLPLSLPSLCEKGLVKTFDQRVNDSVFCITPFNGRGVTAKSGRIATNETATLDYFYSDGGDSGSVIVGKHGVIGVHVARPIGNPGNSKKSIFMDMKKFEDLYFALRS